MKRKVGSIILNKDKETDNVIIFAHIDARIKIGELKHSKFCI